MEECGKIRGTTIRGWKNFRKPLYWVVVDWFELGGVSYVLLI